MARRYVSEISSPCNQYWHGSSPCAEIKMKSETNGGIRTPGMPWIPDPSLSHLLYSMRKVGPKIRLDDSDPDCVAEAEEDFEFLEHLLQNKELNALVKAHSVILFCNQEQCPCVSNTCEITADVMDDIKPYILMIEECRELYAILTTPHVRNLLASHDIVAQRDYMPKLSELPIEIDEDEDEETVKIVQLVKSNEPQGDQQSCEPIVGATIKADEATGRILIARVMHGGAADRSGLISCGDEVIEVNGINVEGKTPNDVLRILQMAQNTITFKLIPNDNKASICETRIRLRALFDYDPDDDKFIPCKEAGLPFRKGDILHIVSQDDPYWWQARREYDCNMRSGLIPSRALQERRIANDRIGESEDNGEFDLEDIPTYEEAARLFPIPGTYRPIVLIGPPGVGRNELKKKLTALDQERFRAAIPHTSRPSRPGEVHGKDYFFETRDQMQLAIEAGRYIEHGEYRGNLYGTSVDSIGDFILAGYQPIVSPHYQALKMLRTPDLKPFIINIAPPSFDVLKETRQQNYPKSTYEDSSSRNFTDDELHAMIQAAEKMELTYGHLFDITIVNDDLVFAFDELVRAIKKLDQEPQWIPAYWIE